MDVPEWDGNLTPRSIFIFTTHCYAYNIFLWQTPTKDGNVLHKSVTGIIIGNNLYNLQPSFVYSRKYVRGIIIFM